MCASSYGFLKVEGEGCSQFRLFVGAVGSNFVPLHTLRGFLLLILADLRFALPSLDWLEILAILSYLTPLEVLHCSDGNELMPIQGVLSSQGTLRILHLISSLKHLSQQS